MNKCSHSKQEIFPKVTNSLDVGEAEVTLQGDMSQSCGLLCVYIYMAAHNFMTTV